MTKQEVIERLCKLTDSMGETHGRYYATDCFCGKGRQHENPDDFRFDDAILDLIERGVLVLDQLSSLGRPQ